MEGAGLTVLVICCLVASYSDVTSAAKILFIPFPWRSHFASLATIADQLVARGNDVSMVVLSSETYHHVYRHSKVVVGCHGLPNDTFPTMAQSYLEQRLDFDLQWLLFCRRMNMIISTCLLNDRDFISAAKAADVFVSDTLLNSASILAMRFNRKPVVLLSPVGYLCGTISPHIGIDCNPAFVPVGLSGSIRKDIGLPARMSFLQRTANQLFYAIIYSIARCILMSTNLYSMSVCRVTTITAIAETTQMVLIPTDYSLEIAIDLPPQVRLIGPLTVRDGQPLPASMATHRQRVLASFGSAHSLDAGSIEVLLQTFTQLNMDVLWSFNVAKLRQAIEQSDTRWVVSHSNGSQCMTIGSNVKVCSWLSQIDLLADNNTAVFVSHCGTNGIYEAIYHRVPNVCIPFFGDHFETAARVLDKGIGEVILISDLSVEKLVAALKTVSRNGSMHKMNVHKSSTILRHTLRTPPNKVAADWVEFVASHRRVDFFKPRAKDAPFYEAMRLDLLFVCFFIIPYISYRLMLKAPN